jgi:hypothetical protein
VQQEIEDACGLEAKTVYRKDNASVEKVGEASQKVNHCFEDVDL